MSDLEMCLCVIIITINNACVIIRGNVERSNRFQIFKRVDRCRDTMLRTFARPVAIATRRNDSCAVVAEKINPRRLSCGPRVAQSVAEENRDGEIMNRSAAVQRLWNANFFTPRTGRHRRFRWLYTLRPVSGPSSTINVA